MLDLLKVVAQIETFTTTHASARQQFQHAIEEACRRLQQAARQWQTAALRLHNCRTSWLVARWNSPPDAVHPAPPPITPCTVHAADGSQIVSNRHDFALCYLINIGHITLHYGPEPAATLHSIPTLHAAEEDPEDPGPGEPAAIPPRRLAVKRFLAECDALAECATHNPANTPAIALLDGSLILWALENETDTFRQQALEHFHRALDRFQKHRIPLIGYISRPASRDVINALRVSHCPHPRADCDRFCPDRNRPAPLHRTPQCAGTERVTDADLFARILTPGARSTTFQSPSRILECYPQPHRIHFFYLHAGDEIARVEIPHWVAEDLQLLERVHALCLDQIYKGDGYPVALAEAHELAVIRAPEREAFFQLLEHDFIKNRQPVICSRKNRAKRTRRI